MKAEKFLTSASHETKHVNYKMQYYYRIVNIFNVIPAELIQ